MLGVIIVKFYFFSSWVLSDFTIFLDIHFKAVNDFLRWTI